MIESRIRSLQFQLRERFLGRIVLRSKLPSVNDPKTVTQEHLFYQLLCEATFSELERGEFSAAIDVGCRNGSYLAALARLFPNARLTGVELDANRRYWNLYRRSDYARAFAKACAAQVVFGDFKNLSTDALQIADHDHVLFAFFFPFVSDNPCLKWGLPSNYADFRALLQRVLAIKAKFPKLKAQILAVHQGAWEKEKSKEILESLCIQPSHEYRFDAEQFRSYWPSKHSIHSHRIIL